jgi:uncharacterized membrane-anchored protein YjiN (DUF445 family)
VDEIRINTSSYGKAKLILRDGRYFIECQNGEYLEDLMKLKDGELEKAYDRCKAEKIKKMNEKKELTEDEIRAKLENFKQKGVDAVATSLTSHMMSTAPSTFNVYNPTANNFQQNHLEDAAEPVGMTLQEEF